MMAFLLVFGMCGIVAGIILLFVDWKFRPVSRATWARVAASNARFFGIAGLVNVGATNWPVAAAFGLWAAMSILAWYWLRRPPGDCKKALGSLGYKAQAAKAKLLAKLKPVPEPSPVPV
jgi:hypothetical protein